MFYLIEALIFSFSHCEKGSPLPLRERVGVRLFEVVKPVIDCAPSLVAVFQPGTQGCVFTGLCFDRN